MNELRDFEWFNESIAKVEYCNWLYNFICFCTGRRKNKFTYKEMFLFIYGLNRNKLGEKKAKEAAMIRLVQIYKYLNNNNLPKGINI
jgi:hypothetical protein